MATGRALLPTEIETSTIRKLRTRIIPFVFVLFVINFVDRINIGFAALTMNRELAITSQQFGFLSGIFFLGYFIFEIPSNLLLHKLGARIWIARILVSWGIVAILTGFVRTATHLYLLRFLLGVAEAGFVPGMYLYLMHWFPQRQLAHAIALFNSAAPIASVVGAPISGVILDQIHWFGLSSWRWLLILEGIPAIVGGIVTYFLLPSRPTEAKFLTQQERNYLVAELGLQEEGKVVRPNHSTSDASPRSGLASDGYLLHSNGRNAHDDLLDATVAEDFLQPIFEYHGGNLGDDPLRCCCYRNDFCLPQFGSCTRTPLSRRCSRYDRSNLSRVARCIYHQFCFLFCHVVVFRGSRSVQSASPFLVDAK